jgi:hypothetical protein
MRPEYVIHSKAPVKKLRESANSLEKDFGNRAQNKTKLIRVERIMKPNAI